MSLKKIAKIIWLLPLLLFFVIALNYRLESWVIPGYFSYDIKRILELLLLTIMVLWLLLSITTRRSWLGLYAEFPGLLRIAILIILVLGIVSVCYAPVQKMAILEYCLIFLLFVGIVFVAAQRMRYGELIDKALVLIIVTGAILYVFTYLYVYIKVMLFGGTLKFFPGFINERFLAQYLGWVLPLATLPMLLWNKISKPLKVALYLLIGILWTIAIINQAKGLFLSLVVAGIFVAILFRGAAKKWFLSQATVIAIGLIGYAISIYLAVSVRGLTALAGSSAARLSMWHIALSMLWAHPLFGVGPMHYAHYPNAFGAHPHDSLLLIGAEWGLPVLALILFTYIRALILWCKKHNYSKNSKILPIALTASFITASCYSLLTGVIVMPVSQVMLIVVVGWMLGFYYQDKKLELIPRFLAEVIFILVIGLALGGVLIGTMPEILFLTRIEFKWGIAHVHNHTIRFFPRFWVQGWF